MREIGGGWRSLPTVFRPTSEKRRDRHPSMSSSSGEIVRLLLSGDRQFEQI
ncbi:MAG: hypothetical protein P2A85_29145 (plasmid) [Microcoleus anatoxicus]|uniref:hypothetical protein n=1 Tax=Microcoleus anatoxicus TaxID=2705319 RepID=UPI00366D6865